MKAGEVRLGQVYRSTSGGLFGGRGPEWQVVSVVRRRDGLTYATLAMMRDPSELKTLVTSVLLNRRMYRLEADAAVGEPSLTPESRSGAVPAVDRRTGSAVA